MGTVLKMEQAAERERPSLPQRNIDLESAEARLSCPTCLLPMFVAIPSPWPSVLKILEFSTMALNTSWLRRNWLLAAGVAFAGLHGTFYALQKIAKSSTKSVLASRD
ncbi:unnamed protein product [Lampetra fluviatilis]